MKKNEVCYKCEKRHAGCHSTCEDYITECEEIDAEHKEIEADRQKRWDLDGYLSEQAMKRRRK